jgi:hypothetical protein
MSSDDNVTIGQKRQCALQLGPRKKPYVLGDLHVIYFQPVLITALEPTLWCTMADTLDVQSTLYVALVRFWTMECCVWESFQNNQTKILHTSKEQSSSGISFQFEISRERREHRVFRQLLLLIPGLEERLMEGSDENFAHIAELVGQFLPGSSSETQGLSRSRKAFLAPEPMTPKAWRVPSWTGSLLADNRWIRHWLAILRLIVDSIMNGLALYCARLAWTGQTPSKDPHVF